MQFAKRGQAIPDTGKDENRTAEQKLPAIPPHRALIPSQRLYASAQKVIQTVESQKSTEQVGEA
jgi:hypothetical protein